MKTINLETSKRLAPYLENIDTEYNWYYHKDNDWYIVERTNHLTTRGIKTLTLEEAIEFLPKELNTTNGIIYPYIDIITNSVYYSYNSGRLAGDTRIFYGNLLDGVEAKIGYLLDNHLLGQKQEKKK